MKIRLLGAIGAIILALIGALLLFSYVRGADERARAGIQTKDVLVVMTQIPAKTPVEALGEFVQVEAVPVSVLAPDAVSDLSESGGRITAVDLMPGEQLLATRLVDPEDLVAPGTVPVPDGLQEVSVLLAPDRVVGGRLQAGDTVGVFGTFDNVMVDGVPTRTTHLMMHKVLVTSVQGALTTTTAETDESTAPAAPAVPTGSVYVTLAVNAKDAETIVYTAEFGRFWLSKEPADATEDGTRVLDIGGIYP